MRSNPFILPSVICLFVICTFSVSSALDETIEAFPAVSSRESYPVRILSLLFCLDSPQQASGLALAGAVVQSADKMLSKSDLSSDGKLDPIEYDPENRVKYLHKEVSDLINFGVSYIELPIKQIDHIWQLSRNVEFLHRLYFIDIAELKIFQHFSSRKGYSITADVKKAYEHVNIPPDSYKLVRREKITVRLCHQVDREKAFGIYKVWKFLLGR